MAKSVKNTFAPHRGVDIYVYAKTKRKILFRLVKKCVEALSMKQRTISMQIWILSAHFYRFR